MVAETLEEQNVGVCWKLAVGSHALVLATKVFLTGKKFRDI